MSKILKKLVKNKPIQQPEEEIEIIEQGVQDSSKYHSSLFSYYAFQPEAVSFMLNKTRAILALPTGTGKTLVSMSVYAHLKEKNPNLKLIFVTDKSVVIQAAKTVDKFFTLTQTYIYGDRKSIREQKYKDFTKNLDILILNYAMLRTDVEEFQDIVGDIGENNIMLVCDEANNVAGNGSKIHTIVRNMTEVLKYVYYLTATVSKGKLEDYYNLIKCLGETEHDQNEFIENFVEVGIQIFGLATYKGNKVRGHQIQSGDKYILRFGLIELLGKGSYLCPSPTATKNVLKNNIILTLPKSKWEVPRKAYSSIKIAENKTGKISVANLTLTSIYKPVGYRNLSKFKKAYNNILYSKSKKEIAEHLPDFIKTVYHVDEDEKTHSAMVALYDEYKNEPAHSQINIVLTYPGYIDENLKEHKNEKIQKLLHILSDDIPEDEKVIIYHTSKQTINFTYDALTKAGYKCNRITGDIVKEREQEKQDFINYNKILLMTDAGGVGVDGLQVANNIIFLGLPITGGQLAQIAGRISRINTTHNKLSLYFILTANSYDTDKYNAIMSQLNLMRFLDKNSIDGGLIDVTIEDNRTEEESEIFIKEQIWNRRKQYSKTKSKDKR